MTQVQWRYIPPFSAPGDLQLALDHWLLDQCAGGRHAPTLRFYTWHPTTLSLGYFQKDWPQHWSSLRWGNAQIPLVRRPTGGRAVLHHGDLTYAIIAADLPRNRRQAYRQLCSFLIEGWYRLGLSLQYGQGGQGYHHQSNCFQVATSADLVRQNGEKFIGSAQCWRGNTVLQHGSMKLQANHPLYQLVFGTPPIRKLKTYSATSELSGEPMPPVDKIIPALKAAAEYCFQASCQTLPLTKSEWQDIATYIPQTKVYCV